VELLRRSSSLRGAGRFALVAISVMGVTLVAPAASASPGAAASKVESAPSRAGDVGILAAPVGKDCGAYRATYFPNTELHYYHCGWSSVEVEIDNIYLPNTTTCVHAWTDPVIARTTVADNAWFTGNLC
jgi:hypothetical protein